MFLGIPDFSVTAAYLLMIIATAVCVVYGVRMWNKEGDLSEKEIEEERRWATEETDLEKDLANNGGDK